MGGLLADPAKQYNWRGKFWQDNPYLLPCAVTSMAHLVSLLLVFRYLYEPQITRHQYDLPVKPHVVDLSLPDPQHPASQSEDTAASEATALLPRPLPPKPSVEAEVCGQFPRAETLGFWDIFGLRAVFLTSMMYGLVGLVQSMNQEVLPLWGAAPLNTGGLQFSSAHIGILNSATGFAYSVFQLLLFPRMCRAQGATRIYAGGALCYCPAILLQV